MRGVTVYSVSSYGGSDRVGHLDGLGTLLVCSRFTLGALLGTLLSLVHRTHGLGSALSDKVIATFGSTALTASRQPEGD